MTAVTVLGRKVLRPNSTFLACLCCQKQLETKSSVKNGIILILKSVLKERTQKESSPLKAEYICFY